jgi:hypothetical protein
MYFKTDFSFVKRFNLGGNRRIEARMDLFNVFDTINFLATTGWAGACRVGRSTRQPAT